jgi:hypothetical protein
MIPMLNVSYRKVGGLRFVRVGRLGFSWYLTSKPVHKEPRTHRALAPVLEVRRYPAGSTVVVYRDR